MCMCVCVAHDKHTHTQTHTHTHTHTHGAHTHIHTLFQWDSTTWAVNMFCTGNALSVNAYFRCSVTSLYLCVRVCVYINPETHFCILVHQV